MQTGYEAVIDFQQGGYGLLTHIPVYGIIADSLPSAYNLIFIEYIQNNWFEQITYANWSGFINKDNYIAYRAFHNPKGSHINSYTPSSRANLSLITITQLICRQIVAVVILTNIYMGDGLLIYWSGAWCQYGSRGSQPFQWRVCIIFVTLLIPPWKWRKFSWYIGIAVLHILAQFHSLWNDLVSFLHFPWS